MFGFLSALCSVFWLPITGPVSFGSRVLWFLKCVLFCVLAPECIVFWSLKCVVFCVRAPESIVLWFFSALRYVYWFLECGVLRAWAPECIVLCVLAPNHRPWPLRAATLAWAGSSSAFCLCLGA